MTNLRGWHPINVMHEDPQHPPQQHADAESQQQPQQEPSQQDLRSSTVAMEKAVFGAGCFWGVEARFGELSGVLDTAVGYAGGELEHPTYKEVCTDRTGHAEVVEVTFDPSRLTYESLLDTFFALHDPTQVNRQGPDWGSQYRSVIFTTTEEQNREAKAKIAELSASGAFRKPIATQVLPSTTFWKAEEYHQRYLEKRGMVSCHI
jgi:peptide-methionine (S)-S-oxide reductase